MLGRLRSLVDMVDAAHNERMIKRAINCFTETNGFERFAYLQTAGTEIKTFNTYPLDWQDIYILSNYSRVDPVVTEAKRRMEVFQWSADKWPGRGGSKEARQFRDQAIEFGIRSGVTIPVEGSFGTTLMLTFASSDIGDDNPLLREPAKAAQAVLAIHYRLRMLADTALIAPKRLLSPKEAVCLTWSANGKYAHEIAELTHIHPRTVQHYLDNARRKLGATTVPQAVAIAKDHGLI
ncbi:autoinducer binding domain-containing protein [Pararhizobium sp. BT-229]|uniref:autoinducer binding domain-containing protein n=1 Tax=Pararhizobium sp. BT-229 TaxID=2986923 RepID=UPI0021F7B644|nr:autoinducer binding domain-containing protein [Pararhizobium sp. BT-229]MCV9966926.1 autoinducer binding domain-containing protein [Pararhizobium sp. BT-229]